MAKWEGSRGKSNRCPLVHGTASTTAVPIAFEEAYCRSRYGWRYNERHLVRMPSWQFVDGGAASRGRCAGPVYAIAGAVKDDDPDYLRLAAFGTSALHVVLELSPSDAAVDRVLAIGMQSNGRSYYPAMGTSRIAVELDGAQIGSLVLSSVDVYEHYVYLRAQSLRPGTNDITIRLLAASTTPLRIHWVGVWPLPK